MLDARIRPLIDPPLHRLAAAARQAGWTADGVTITGFVIGLLAIPAIAFEAYGLGLVLIVINRLATAWTAHSPGSPKKPTAAAFSTSPSTSSSTAASPSPSRSPTLFRTPCRRLF